MHFGWTGLGALCVGVATVAACVGDEAAIQGTADAGAQPDATSGSDSGAVGNDAATADAADAADAPEGPRCTPTKPFGAPTLLAGAINSPANESAFSMTSDELTAVISRRTQFGPSEIRYVTRASRSVPFGAAELDKVGSVNRSADGEDSPTLGATGLTLYFHREDVATSGQLIRYSSRATLSDPFAADDAIFVDGVVLPSGVSPQISRDGLRLYFTDVDGDTLFVASRSGAISTFVDKKGIAALLSGPVLSKDELTLYYVDLTGGTVQMRVSTRANLGASFPTGTAMPAEIATKATPLHITDDGCILYIASDRATPNAPGGFDIYEARRPL